MRVGNFEKQPDERRRLSITYSDALTRGDSVSTVELKGIAPAGELTVDTLTVETPQISFFVEGGVDKSTYIVTVTTTSELGEVFEDEISVRVRERN